MERMKIENNLSISIITPTYNRADELGHLLDSISNQSINLDNVQCVISDDGSNDNTKRLIKNWQEKAKFDIIYINQNNQGPGAARNHGLEKSSGDLILFIDSDCEAHPQWIEKIILEYANNPFDACGGPDGAKNDFTLLQKAIDYSMTSFFTTGGMRGHSEKMLAKFYPRTHNMGITRKIFDTIGGFGDLRHGQDIEYSNRIRKSGAKIKFIKDALVYHRRRTSLMQFIRQVFNWGVARVNLGKIDSKMLELIHFLPSFAFLSIVSLCFFTLYNGWNLFNIFLIIFIPLSFISMIGSFKKRDFRIFPVLLLVVPIQVFGYGIGFFQAFIRRFLFNESQLIGFKKNYYK
ncbi:MAG: glycosyltransferase [Candidatus Neomarinimicrobiota bacterium]